MVTYAVTEEKSIEDIKFWIDEINAYVPVCF